MFLQHLFPPRFVPSPFIFLQGWERSCSVLPPCPATLTSAPSTRRSQGQEQAQVQQGGAARQGGAAFCLPPVPRGAGSQGATSQLLDPQSFHGEPALEPNARLAPEALLSRSRLGQVTKG